MNKLRYDEPARYWREALPIGNGHTGVMIYGGKNTEKLCFNDSSLWSGYPKDYNSEESLKHLEEVRKLIFDGKNDKADALAQEKLSGFYSESFLPLGSVKIKIKGNRCSKYRRELDLSSALHTVQSGAMKREAFASYPDKVVCYHIESQTPFSISVCASSKLHHAVMTDDSLNLVGNAPDYVVPNYVRSELFPVKYKEKKGMAFALCVKAETDGKINLSHRRLCVSNATSVNLYFATQTGFIAFDKMPETNRDAVLKECKAKLNLNKSYNEIKNDHIKDFQSVFNKSIVSFGQENESTTDKLLDQVKSSDVPASLAELFYNYGKYMIVSGSRDGSQALNLQGQWNNSVRPPWSSNYTVNINTQMNYWGASRANLDACLEPYLRLVYEALQNGRKTAKINYGCNGFACNHNVDLWRKTPPVKGTCNYMLEPLCGVWLANEIFAHYKNGALQSYRDKVFEIVKDAALFAADYLVLHDGKYVVCPSPSAENSFKTNGKSCSLDYASAFNMGLVKQSFNNYLSFETDDELSARIKDIQPKLFDFQYGENGICEYHKDYEMPERGHRHFSPLYAFYPADVIKYYSDETATQGVKKLFHDRISHSNQYIGWSAAWGICLAAKLHEPSNVVKIMKKFLGHAVFKNLFCMHPPYYFQIDGNLGFVAAVHEILVYEENGVLELIPAIPQDFKNGSVKNLLVNGVQVSFEWKDSKIVSISADKPVTVLKNNLSDQVLLSDNIVVQEKII